MKAAATFVRGLGRDLETKTCRIRATAFGSLAWTGRGHATDKALILGLAGYLPDSVDPDRTEELLARIQCTHRIKLWSGSVIEFVPERDVSFNTVELFERHPNAMRFEAFDVDGQTLIAETWFSIGGGFIEQEFRRVAGERRNGHTGVGIPFRGRDLGSVHYTTLFYRRHGADK